MFISQVYILHAGQNMSFSRIMRENKKLNNTYKAVQLMPGKAFVVKSNVNK